MFRLLRQSLEFVRQLCDLLWRLDVSAEERNASHKPFPDVFFDLLVNPHPIKAHNDELPDFFLDRHSSYRRIDFCVGEGEKLGWCKAD